VKKIRGKLCLSTHSRNQGAPGDPRAESHLQQLFGRSSQEARFGALDTDFTLIREDRSIEQRRVSGASLGRIAENPLSWDSLKRALESAEIAIEDVGEKLGFATTRACDPRATPSGYQSDPDRSPGGLPAVAGLRRELQTSSSSQGRFRLPRWRAIRRTSRITLPSCPAMQE